MMRYRILAGALTLVLLLTACSAGAPAAVTTTSVTSATTAASTTTAAAATTAAVTTTAATTTTAKATTTAAEPSEMQLIGMIPKAQDGAIFGDWLFRFGAGGIGNAYRVSDALKDGWKTVKAVSFFALDRADEIVPHCNSVCFGSEYYDPGDEFPLLYANIYNNYEKEADKLPGTCLVYRLTRDGETFSTQLVQIIRVGFTNDTGFWNGGGVPYGNFAVDTAGNRLVVYLMRKNYNDTRYFLFDLPKVTDGEPHETLGVNCVTLEKDDILSYFDGPYSNFVQGGVVHDGKLYSVEGRGSKYGEAGLRVVDLNAEKELYIYDFVSRGYPSEPELIDFARDRALYADYAGMLYSLDIEAIEAEALNAQD